MDEKSTIPQGIDNIFGRMYTAAAEEAVAMLIPCMLTVFEAAQVLRVSPKTLYKMIKEGDIKYVLVRGQYRISSQAITEYIEQGGSVRER